MAGNVAEKTPQVCSSFHKGLGQGGKAGLQEGRNTITTVHIAKESNKGSVILASLKEEFDDIYPDFGPLESVCSARESFGAHR